MLGKAGWVDLEGSFQQLEQMPVILTLLALFVLDFVADKVPAVDHAMHSVGLVIHPIAGATLFDLQAGGDLPLIVNLLAGGSVAGALHAARATARPAVNAASGGMGAPVASLLEDVASLLLTVVAFLIPALAAVVVVAMLVGAVLVARRARRALRRRRDASTTPRYPSRPRRRDQEPPRAPRR